MSRDAPCGRSTTVVVVVVSGARVVAVVVGLTTPRPPEQEAKTKVVMTIAEENRLVEFNMTHFLLSAHHSHVVGPHAPVTGKHVECDVWYIQVFRNGEK